MTITRKFWMLSVAGILTTGVASALVGSNLNDIARHWKEKTTITERLNRAAYEMEINVNGAGMAVMKYLLTRDPRNIERFDKDVSNFRQFWAEFSQTASDTESQGLAKRARESFDAYTDLGTSLIALTDTRRNLLDSIIKDMSELDDSINRYQDLLREAPEKMALFLAMEADLAQTFARLMLYLSDQDSGNRRAVHDYLERFSKQVGEFTSGARTEGEKRSAEGLASIWKSLSGTVVKAMNGSDLSRSSLERLIQLRRQLDDILDEEVQKLTSNRDSIADAQIGSAISKGVVELAVASIFITIFLVIGLLIFYRDVISPLGTVTAAAEQLTRENFEHRVPIAAPNEMGKVGVALNVMAERLGRVIGELHKSRAFLEERVKEQTDDLLRVNQSLQQEIATCKRIHQELSDQKKLMADILDNMDDSIVVFDREMRITAFNPSYQRRFFSGTPLIGRTCRAVCTEFPHRCTECPAETTLAEMRPVHKLESRLRAEDPGRAVEWFDVRTSLLTDEREGEIRGVIESRRDVSDHVSLEVQLRHAQKMEAVGTLAGGIAHDFNNRLQVVIGYTDLLLLNKKPMDREYERLYAIRKVAMDGAELVKSLLAFSRKIEPAIRVLNLNKEIERVRRMLERVVSKAIR
ncbi:MAG: HAMP domain-containing protein, partial [Planctomycetes bacterium]|nr:HAMP domain-containing protein [Planctomycetota bacterium]